jgi:hypothetical protein
MKINKGLIIVGLMIAFGLFFELAAYADTWDQATTITFNQPVQIPGRVLPAGTYVFKLANLPADRNMVQIFVAGGTQLYATVQGIATERPEPAPATVITLAKPGDGQPVALLNWFYPGEEIGAEFVYPQAQEKQLAQSEHQTIVGNGGAELSLEAGY